MSSLGDLLSSDQISKLSAGAVEIGNVYGMHMDEEDGITPHAGEESRYKYFIVLGKDNEGKYFGGVVINSNVNQNINPVLQRLHMPIRKVKYSFLKKDSFVNCSNFMTARLEKFLNWDLLGKIDNDDVTIITETIKESPLVRKVTLKNFGLLD